MSFNVKECSNIYLILTYTATETRVVYVIYTKNLLFWTKITILLTSKSDMIELPMYV